MQQGCRQGTAQYDQRCRPIDQGAHMAAFEEVTAHDGDKSQDQANQAEHVHQTHASTRCRPISSRLYTASARLALTIAMGMP